MSKETREAVTLWRCRTCDARGTQEGDGPFQWFPDGCSTGGDHGPLESRTFLPDSICRETEAQAEKAARELEGVEEFLETVTQWTGSDPDEWHEAIDALRRAAAYLRERRNGG